MLGGDGRWQLVEPIPGALTINVGDQCQVGFASLLSCCCLPPLCFRPLSLPLPRPRQRGTALKPACPSCLPALPAHPSAGALQRSVQGARAPRAGATRAAAALQRALLLQPCPGCHHRAPASGAPSLVAPPGAWLGRGGAALMASLVAPPCCACQPQAGCLCPTVCFSAPAVVQFVDACHPQQYRPICWGEFRSKRFAGGWHSGEQHQPQRAACSAGTPTWHCRVCRQASPLRVRALQARVD